MAWPGLNVVKKLHPDSGASSPKYDHDTSEMGPELAPDLSCASPYATFAD